MEGTDGSKDRPLLLSRVDDHCLEKVLIVDQKTIGGGGVAYLFKKTTGVSWSLQMSMPLLLVVVVLFDVPRGG